VPEHPHGGGSGIYLPRTTAAEAVCAAHEVPLVAVLGQARERVVRLELARLGRLLALYGDVRPAVLYTAFPTLRERLAHIDALPAARPKASASWTASSRRARSTGRKRRPRDHATYLPIDPPLPQLLEQRLRVS
jgi:hypothetical protein